MDIVKATEQVARMAPKEGDFSILTREEFAQAISVAWLSGMQDAIIGGATGALGDVAPALALCSLETASARTPLRDMTSDWLARNAREEP